MKILIFFTRIAQIEQICIYYKKKRNGKEYYYNRITI